MESYFPPQGGIIDWCKLKFYFQIFILGWKDFLHSFLFFSNGIPFFFFNRYSLYIVCTITNIHKSRILHCVHYEQHTCTWAKQLHLGHKNHFSVSTLRLNQYLKTKKHKTWSKFIRAFKKIQLKHISVKMHVSPVKLDHSPRVQTQTTKTSG